MSRESSDFRFGVSEFTTNPWPFEHDVETYARLGVQAMEVCEVKLDISRFAEQMQLPARAGLTVTSVQPSVRTLFPGKSQPEPKDIDARMERFRTTIRHLAPHAPGASFVTNTGIAPGGNIQEVYDRAVREYRTLADFAADYGVRLALEPLHPVLMNTESAIWTIEQAMQIVHNVGRENFGICLDVWNVWQNADLDAQIRSCGDRIFVVHLSDWRTPRSSHDRLIPGHGLIPLASFLRAVRDTDFAGTYSVEIFSSDVPDALWEGDLEQVIRDSRAGFENAAAQANL